MQEVAFLRQNAEKWKQFETLLRQRPAADPDHLAALFIEITDDLSYARTFYPGSQTTRYLNALAADVHKALYRNRREDRRRFVRFWAREVPAAAWEARRPILVSFVLFVVSLGIGFLSALNDSGFARLMLGDAYVNMTLENIASGDPMAVYKQANEFEMFLAITFNNVRVSFFAFAMGLLGSFGTAYVLFSNGVRIGAFHAIFQQQEFLGGSLLVVYIHGALELSAIVIAGGAGLAMGNRLLFPGAFSRRTAFMRGARLGAKLIVGLVPVFVVAGFLEGYVTRHTGMPLLLSLGIIFGSFVFIVWYFVLYPRRLYARRSPASREADPAA